MLLFLFLACIPRDAFLDAYAEASCDFMERCGRDWTENAEFYGVETCHDLFVAAHEDRGLAEDWDPARAAECVDWRRHDASCDESTEAVTPCDGLFQ